VKQEVGGIMFVEALKALAKDEHTRVILLVSKPPHPRVLRRIERVIKTLRKPVVACFIGAPRRPGEPGTLEEAALQAVALARGEKFEATAHRLAARDESLASLAAGEVSRRTRGQQYVRGLFSGGTFCAEAQVILRNMVPLVYSNVPVPGAKQLRDPLVSQGNTLVDLGEDEFTVGRPHPMIDYSLRNRRILEEAADPATAVVLLDVVLGYGANPDPAAELGSVLRKATRKVAVVCSITGTDQDPQNRSRIEAGLRKAGAIVLPSNAAACKMAGCIVACLSDPGKRGGKNR
jgi:FdrA protein